eukprot:5835254-Amphidinium_carterae.1
MDIQIFRFEFQVCLLQSFVVQVVDRVRILMSGDAHATSFKCRGCLKQMMGRLNDTSAIP